MRTFGWAYVTLYTLDFSFSIIASFASTLETFSNRLSFIVLPLTFIAFIFALLNKLKPKMLFLLLSGSYFVFSAFGIVLAITLIAKLGSGAPHIASLQFLKENISWFWPAHWIFLIIWAIITVFGWVKLVKQIKDEKGDVRAERA